jgi:hypothetical protein
VRPRLSPPEKFVIFALLGLGLIACLAIPISAGYDEETHFIRAWEMAHLYFIPNEQLGAKLPFPSLYWELSYRRQPIVQAADAGLWSKYGGLRMDAHDYVYANVETRSVYSPALLLPQALALRYLGLSLQLPALAVYYACRIVGLLSYLILGWLAVRLIPYGKWPLAILIVSPMALFQASTISADTISNGIGFLFVGSCLAMAAASDRNGPSLSSRGKLDPVEAGSHEKADGKDIGWKQWAALVGLLALLFLCKVNLIFLALLPFLLISPARFKMKHGYALLAAAALTLLLVEVAGWNLVAYSRFTRALEGANPREQLLFIAANPLLFVKIIAQDVWMNTPAYMQGWVGVYGYNYWPVPGLTYLLYPLAVVLCLRQSPWLPSPDKRTRILLLCLFLFGYLLTIISLYVAFTPVRSLLVAGVQGRYFTVVMPLLFLAFLGLFSHGAPTATRQSPRLGIIFAAASLTLYMGGLLLSYHVSCGSQYYRLDLCYQPEYKNWAPETASSPIISPTLTLTQEIVPACDGMTELRVWVNRSGTDPTGTTTLTLRAPNQQKDLVEQTFTNAEISRDGWLTVRFSPEWQSDNQLYLLKLAGSSPNGNRIGYSGKAEYLDGKLFENETPVAEDVLFQYGCIAGLRSLQVNGK